MDPLAARNLLLQENSELFKKLFEKHWRYPQITISQHKQHLFDLINKFVSPKKKIYLDTNYWIRFRDVELGRSVDADVKTLYEAIKFNVSSNNYLCPVSSDILSEMSKQKDPITKEAMCKVMDYLSQGTCIVNSLERIDLEIKEAVYTFTNRSREFSAKDFVWTKVSFVFGSFIPQIPDVDEPRSLAVSKAVYDFLYSIKITDIMKLIKVIHGDVVLGDMDFESFCAKLNQSKKAHATENKTFTQALKSELYGSMDAASDKIIQVLEDMFLGQTYQGEIIKKDSIQRLVAPIINGVCEGIISGKFNRLTPSIAIPCKLHAAIRWDLNRKYKPNDYADIFHTAAATAYYDYYFTEKSFKSLSTSSPLKLDEIYSTKIYSSPKECINAFYRDKY